MNVWVAGAAERPAEGAGKKFVTDFASQWGARRIRTPSTPRRRQVLVTAIEKSDGSRADVAAKLFETNVTNGILGTFKIDANGDTTSNPVTVYSVKGGKQTDFKVITPPQSLVKTA